MLVTLILGLFLSSSQEVKQQTQKHLMAMQRMTAVETVENRSHTVAYYDNQQAGVQRLVKHGVGVQSAWWVVLRDSQVWRWESGNGVDGGSDNRSGVNSWSTYRYRDTCAFTSGGRVEQVPCDGTIEVEGLDVRRITQRLHTRKWGVVTLDLKYGWVELSERRLVPQSLTLGWRDKTITATWSGYQEYRATEPKVSEAEAEADDEATIEERTAANRQNDPQGLDGVDIQSSQGKPASRSLERRRDSLDTLQDREQRDPRPVDGDSTDDGIVRALLTLPKDAVWKEVKVKKSWWKRLLIVKVKK